MCTYIRQQLFALICNISNFKIAARQEMAVWQFKHSGCVGLLLHYFSYKKNHKTQKLINIFKSNNGFQIWKKLKYHNTISCSRSIQAAWASCVSGCQFHNLSYNEYLDTTRLLSVKSDEKSSLKLIFPALRQKIFLSVQILGLKFGSEFGQFTKQGTGL